MPRVVRGSVPTIAGRTVRSHQYTKPLMTVAQVDMTIGDRQSMRLPRRIAAACYDRMRRIGHIDHTESGCTVGHVGVIPRYGYLFSHAGSIAASFEDGIAGSDTSRTNKPQSPRRCKGGYRLGIFTQIVPQYRFALQSYIPPCPHASPASRLRARMITIRFCMASSRKIGISNHQPLLKQHNLLRSAEIPA